MNRRVAYAAGAMLLAGLGSWASPAFSQGPMAPRMDVAPPPRVAPPPPPPVFIPPTVVPPPPMVPVAPVMAPPVPAAPAPKTPTASAPATPTPAAPAPVATPTPAPAPPPATASQAPRGTASTPPPYTDSQVKALRGVGVSLRGPGGQRQVTSDSNGVVSLGQLRQGTYELGVNKKSLGTGTQPNVQPAALIGLLLPAVQKARPDAPSYVSANIPPVNDPDEQIKIKVEVDAKGRVSSIDWGGGKASINVAVGDVNGDGRADIKLFEDLAKRNTSGETRLAFVLPVAGPEKPKPNYINNPIPGVDIIVEKNPGGRAATQTTDSNGTSTLGVLTPGTHSVSLDTKKLLEVRSTPGTSGSAPAQPAGVLISLLIPAVQKLGGAPQPTTVEHSLPRSFLARSAQVKIDIVVPDGGGSPKVDWGDGSPLTDVGRDGVPAPSGLRISADVSTLRVSALSSPETVPGGPGTPTASASVAPAPAAPIPSASQGTPRGTAGGPPPYTDSQMKALPGVSVSLRGPGGTRQATSDSNGVLSLGQLRQGRYDLSVNRKTLGGGTGSPPALIGLLLPAVQSVREGAPRYVSTNIPPVNDPDEQLQIKVEVDARGQVSSVNWGDGKASINVAVGDFNGDGRAEWKQFEDLALRNPSGETRLAFARLGQATPMVPAPSSRASAATAPVTPPPRPDALTDGLLALRFIGVTATGPGGVLQTRSDGDGWSRLGKLPIGNTVVEFSGPDLASALKTTVGPNTPMPQKTLIELLVVIAIVAIKTDGTPVVFTGSVPASAVKTLKADLRIGRDGNLMDVNWGNGPQLPQILPKTAAATLTVPGPNGPIPVNPALVKSLQDRASKSAPGLVDANTAMGEISTTR